MTKTETDLVHKGKNSKRNIHNLKSNQTLKFQSNFHLILRKMCKKMVINQIFHVQINVCTLIFNASFMMKNVFLSLLCPKDWVARIR